MTMERREREALDRHITGNYGEDQFAKGRREAVEDEQKFLAWKGEVDRHVQALVGLGCDDLPDQPYRDWFDDGMDSGEAASEAIENAILDM